MKVLGPGALLLAAWSCCSAFRHPPVPASSRRSSCKPVPSTMGLCRGIGYSEMRLPNLLGHDSMKEALQQAASWGPLLTKQCHRDTQKFLCSLFAPVCLSELDEPVFPCRSLCQAVREGCTPVMAAFGFPWPEMLNCSKFPQGDDELCIPPAGPGGRLELPREELRACNEGCRCPLDGSVRGRCDPAFRVQDTNDQAAESCYEACYRWVEGTGTGFRLLATAAGLDSAPPAQLGSPAVFVPPEPDVACAACLDSGQQAESGFLEKVCTQDFALKMSIKSLSGVGGDLKVVPESKSRTLYKQDGWSEAELKKPVLWLAGGEACSCEELVGPGSVVLAMGHRVAGRLVLSWVRRWRRGEKELKKFSRALRRLQC